MDKPGLPEGPLTASDIHADHCTLNWKPPVDDGGSPIDHYNLEKFDMTAGHWVPCGKTPDAGVQMQVNNLIPVRRSVAGLELLRF
jgi:hypothetical protein